MKIQIALILLAIFSVTPLVLIQANTTNNTSICTPKLLTETKELFAKGDSCAKESYEKEIGNVLLFVQKEFADSINLLKKDNVLNAEQMAHKTINVYREYKQCLDVICRNIVQSCSSQTSQAEELGNFSTCQAKANIYKKIQKISLTSINQENAAYKSRSLVRERARVFEKKMHAWFVPVLIKLINNTSNFAAKVSTLVRSPI